ncbi:hypothetical protein [Peribacillus frigoritolerans]|uniref:hypothetical protein n=1 Tax=Peribacillus frigoritolerans TaxID=450367 RepID=UPI003CFEDEA3
MPPATYILHMNFTLLLVNLADLLVSLAELLVNSAHLLVINIYGNQLRPPTWKYS